MDKQQVILVKWWIPKENYRDIYECLEGIQYKPYDLKKKNRWNTKLWNNLGEGYELLLPIANLNKYFADYLEWKILFEKSFKYLREEVILIWHSLWWCFLTKYLNENSFPVKIKQIFFIAPCFKDSEQEVLGSFNFDKSLEKFKKYSDKITMYYSTDDFVVPVSDFENFKAALPEMKYREFNDRWHFLWEKFPEILEDIKNV